MTTTAPPASYRQQAGAYDEMLDAAGQPRGHWAHLSGALRELGHEELLRRREEAARLVDQDGVVYNAYEDSAPSRTGRRWLLDPVPTVVSSRDWETVESGLIERAELLNLILEDLYGERELLRRGLLPAEIVLGHPGFLRQCDQIRLPGSQQLFSYAADLGRDLDGNPVVLSDRTQAPSGFGYALEARTVVSRVFPTLYRDAQVHRLAPFFRSLRVALQRVAPAGIEDPRIVVLTPGPWNETAFEHAFLASTLGYPLVEGADLTVRGGSVWMRSLGRLEPVHVILRRVDGAFCDPLELRPDSQLGVPGLVEASRRGSVSVVNSLGASVLENPALMAFLPSLCRTPAGQPAATAERADLVVRRGPGAPPRPGQSRQLGAPSGCAGAVPELGVRGRAESGRARGPEAGDRGTARVVGRPGSGLARLRPDADREWARAAAECAASVRGASQRLLRRHARRA